MASCGDTATTTCLQCESVIAFTVTRGRRPAYCSDGCRQAYHRRRRKGLAPAFVAAPPKLRTRRMPHPCAHCGTNTTRPRFCTVKCSQAARDRRRGRPTWAERFPMQTLVERSCVTCGAKFTRRSRRSDAAKCCSRDCGFKLLRWEREKLRRVTEAKALFAKWARDARPKPPRLVVDAVKLCRDCGQGIDKGQQRCALCRETARECRRKRSRLSPGYRANKVMRKALARGRIQGAERFDPLEILARDGWRCHLCGVATPKRLRGTHDDRAPELDHIQPLAQGGQHTRLNTACACRRCNIAKGGKHLGQLRLVA